MTPPAAKAPPEAPALPGHLDHSRLTYLLGYATSRASIELKKDFRRHLGGPLGLKAVEFSILMLLLSNKDVNPKQLCEALDVSAPNMAITIDRLAERGWVERSRSTRDRRAVIVDLTPAGRDFAQRADRIARSMEQTPLRVLTAAERALLIELLFKVAAGRSDPA